MNQVVIVNSRERLNELQREHAGFIRAATPIAFECREWVPVISGYDEWADPHVTYRKVAFKAQTREAVERKADHGLAQALIGLPEFNGKPTVRNLFEDDYFRCIELKRHAAKEALRKHQAVTFPTLSDFVTMALKLKEADRVAKGSSVETARHYAKHLAEPTVPSDDPELFHEPFVIGQVPIDMLTMGHLREFVRSLSRKKSTKTGKELSPKTIENIVGVIATAWSTLKQDSERAKLFGQLHFDKQALPRQKYEQLGSETLYSDSEIQALIDHARDEREQAFMGLALTGIRPPGEVAGVRWTDFFVENGERFLRVERQIQGRKEQPTKTGARGERVVPVPPGLWELIQATRRLADSIGSPYVLPDFENSNHPISTKTLQDRFIRLKARAGISRPNARMYDLRATVLSKYRRSIDADTVRRIAGHTNTRMLEKHYDRNQNAEMVKGLGAVLGWGPSKHDS